MRNSSIVIAMGLAVLLTAACHKSPTSPSSQGLPGVWRATRAEYTNGSNPGQRLEVVARGTTLVLTLNAGSTYTLTITDPGEAGTTANGSWSATQDVLTLKPSNITGEIQFDMVLSGSTLTLSGGHVLFDFGDGSGPQESILNATLTRQ
jgi:Lipocalin-like domain